MSKKNYKPEEIVSSTFVRAPPFADRRLNASPNLSLILVALCFKLDSFAGRFGLGLGPMTFDQNPGDFMWVLSSHHLFSF